MPPQQPSVWSKQFDYKTLVVFDFVTVVFLLGVIVLLVFPHSMGLVIQPFWPLFLLLGIGIIIYTYISGVSRHIKIQRYIFLVLFVITLLFTLSTDVACTKFGGSWVNGYSNRGPLEVCRDFNWNMWATNLPY